MTIYKNLNKNSGVLSYEIGHDFITVQFSSGRERFYKYTYLSAGSNNIEQMKSLAVQGFGLNSFIMKQVKDDFESKW